MSETLSNSLFAILKGSPIAIALLIMYYLGNVFWGDRMSEMINNQRIINERMASAVEKISETQKDLVHNIEVLHALLVEHIRGR